VRLVARAHDGPADELRALAQDVARQLEGPKGAAVVLGSAQRGKALLVAATSKNLVERGVSAPELLDPAAKLVGGGAGGKPGLAFSGGPKGDGVGAALETIEPRLKELLGDR
jgi:alanyl-tRNA synthetase